MIAKHLFEGGPLFMSVIYIFWIAVLTLAIRFLIIYLKDKKNIKLKKTNNTILFLGSLTFLIGLLAQIIGMFMALNAIQAAGDISPALIAGGLRVSLIAPLYGFVLFIISGIIWYIYRYLILE